MSDEPKKVNGVSESPVSEYLDHLMKELAKALVLKAIMKAIGPATSAVPGEEPPGRARDFGRVAKFYWLDGTIEEVGVAWPFQEYWKRVGRMPDAALTSPISEIESVQMRVPVHTFTLVKLGYGRAAYFEGGIQHAIRLGALPRESVVVFRATGGDIVTVPTPAQHAARPTEADGDTTVIHPDHAQRLRAGLAEREREHVANNPRVIVQPDYPDWDDGEY